ncbi:MAG: hypothetical protein GKR89_09835 [Candidatus Latescibacteria bacterium]|nr:hypothetical protein [Candidatus Latescibacterota bacterium]
MAAPEQSLPGALERRLRQLARQYSRRQRLRGLVRLGAVVLVLLLGLEAVLPWARSAGLPLWAPVLGFLLAAGLAWWGWRRRLRAQPLDRRRLALFLDERHPELENLAVTSVEFAQLTGPAPWLTQQLLQEARLRTEKLVAEDLLDKRLPRLVLQRTAVWTVVGLAVGLFLWRWGGELGGQGWFPKGAVAWSVEPGDIHLQRSSDQVVWLQGATGEGAKVIHWRRAGGDWQTEAMVPGRTEELYYYRLLRLQQDVEYQVQVGQRQSARYRIEVWTPPAVESLSLVLQYPDYMNRPERVVPEGGDITAPQGSSAQIEVQVNKELKEAHLVLGSGPRIAMEPVPGDRRRWRGRLDIVVDDQYHLALRTAAGEENEPGRPYDIQAQQDQPPQIELIYPRGDDEATPLEEIPIAVAISDDFGLRDFGLQYEVAGRSGQRLSLGAGSAGLLEVEETFILDMEALAVQPGDLVTWSVWAIDERPGRQPFSGVGDPYFFEIRPFERIFRAAVSNQGGAGGGGGGAETPAGRQKKVLIATWNLRRDMSALSQEEWNRRLEIIVAGQGQIDAGPMAQGPLADSLATAVAAALTALEVAELPQPVAELSQAIEQQQRAYHYLLALQPEQMQVQQRAGGGGGGQGAPWERELDALEMTRRRDFRNEASTLNQRQEQAQATLDGLEELARRQQMINRDIDRLLEQDQAEPEEQRRQLARLLEEQRRNQAQLEEMDQSQGLDSQAGREPVEQVREQMAQSAQALRQGSLQGARAAGERALDALEQAGEQVENQARETVAQQLRQLRDDWQLLRLRQEELAAAGERAGTGEEGQPLRLEARDQSPVQAAARDSLAVDLAALMERAGELVLSDPAGQALMVRRLGEWLRATSRAGIYEDMLLGQRLAQRRSWDGVATIDAVVGDKMAQAERELEAVAAALVNDELAGAARALGVLEGLQAEWAQAQADSAAGGDLEGALPDWSGRLRDAEVLLPEGAARRGLAGARGALGGMRSSFSNEDVAPAWEDVERAVFAPVEEAVLQLRRQLRHGLSQGRLEPLDGGAVPALYQDQVAEYFKALGQMEVRR